MRFKWKTILIALLGVAVDVLPTVLEELSKETSSTGDKPVRPALYPSENGGVEHPLQHLKRRATD
jgi:hypothetical protein